MNEILCIIGPVKSRFHDPSLLTDCSTNPLIQSIRFMSTLQTFRRHRKPLGGALAALMAVWQIGQPLQAAPAYFDVNASTAGSGIITGTTYNWNTSTLWNPNALGTGTVAAWGAGDTAIFSAGTDAQGLSYNVVVDAGGQTAGGLTFEEGDASLSGGRLRSTVQWRSMLRGVSGQASRMWFREPLDSQKSAMGT